MTVQELSRYLTLRKQIDEDKEIYENMCQKMGPASPSLSGIQSFTNQIQIVKTDSFCKVVIQFIDGLSADAGCAGKFRLRHAPFAETR